MSAPFVSPVEDIVFSLRHIADAAELTDWDGSLAEAILNPFAVFAENVLEPINAVGDTEGATLVDGRVVMPNGFKEAYSALVQDGWQSLTGPEKFGGQAVSKLTAAGVSEIFSGANHSLQMVCNLVPGAISTLLKFGTPEQQSQWIPKLSSGDVLATMCLTEPAAGSDLSAIRCSAVKTDEQWSINGEKIFISGGDQDLSSSILHLVLARSADSEDRLRGLSLFICAAQPGIRVARIESKLGLHASPTCQLVFDQARAELIGEEGDGLKAMFTLMNHARIDVALQGVAHASRAAYIAGLYAAERQQGRQSDGRPALLSDHADVKRMLDEQQILAHSTRAMCHIALVELERNTCPALIEFLTPLCKIAGSEAGIRAADLAIQILGGYGYLKEYGVEQIWRDARITAIYEGANGIHAKTLVTRGLQQKGATESFSELIGHLSQDNEVVKEKLNLWQSNASRLASMVDPMPEANAFANESIALLEKAIWVKISQKAHHHSQSELLMRLSEQVIV